MKHILVEFYSVHTLENLISLLKDPYDEVKILYFTGKNAPKNSIKKHYRDFLYQHFQIQLKFIPIPYPDITAVLSTLRSFPRNAVYSLDITGGNEIFIAAAGMFFQESQAGTIFLHQFDVFRFSRIFSYPAPPPLRERFPVFLSSEDYLLLNGCKAIASPQFPLPIPSLQKEILSLWQAVGQDAVHWNRFCSFSASQSDAGNSITQKYFDRKLQNKKSYQIICQKLKNARILQNERYDTKNGKDCYSFDLNISPESFPLYDKAGTLLELYTALAATQSGVFHDIRSGLKVDLDGKIRHGRLPEVRNEIDGFFMYQNLPVIVSCKNTAPQNDYLYEIATVALHYGGKYATPVLVSSLTASPTVKKRAKEMGVLLFDGIAKKSFDSFVSLWKAHFPENSHEKNPPFGRI